MTCDAYVHGIRFLVTGLLAVTAPAIADPFSTTVTVNLDSVPASISPNIYGQYLEHVEQDENIIYPALWDDKSTASNADGLRLDVAAEIKQLGVPIIRWPGGCFADVYHWEDGIGPQDQRVAKKNLHWGGMEPNHFGTDEFLRLCKLTDTAPYINVNLGSGTLDEALRWLEYCNSSPTTPQGKRRAQNGHKQPYDVKYWGIGNETWGPWETGHTDADTYGTSLSLWARAMREADPTIKILGVGSEDGNNHDWDSTVLRRAGDEIDFLTVHMYGISDDRHPDDYQRFVFTPTYFENRLQRLVKRIDEITTRPIQISIDEWNIRHFENGKQNRKSPRTLQDALFAAGFFNAMIRQSPDVAMSNYVFLINGNATLLVKDEQVVWTPLAHVCNLYMQHMQGNKLETQVEGLTVTPPRPITGAPNREVPEDYPPAETPWVDAAAAQNPEGKTMIALVNRHPDEAALVELKDKTGRAFAVSDAWILTGDTAKAVNDFESPRNLEPRHLKLAGQASHFECPPMSVVLLECGQM